MTWTIPWWGEPIPWSGIPNSAQFVVELLDLRRRHGVEHRQAAVVGRDRVVRGRHRLARPAYAQAAIAEPREGLRAGHLMDEVQVDREDGRGTGILRDDVVVPDLLDDRARFGHGRDRVAANGWRRSAERCPYTGSTTPAGTIGAVHPTLDSRTTAPRLCSREALQVAMAYPTKPAQVGPDRTTVSAGLKVRVRGMVVRGPLRSPATRVWLFTALVASLALSRLPPRRALPRAGGESGPHPVAGARVRLPRWPRRRSSSSTSAARRIRSR